MPPALPLAKLRRREGMTSTMGYEPTYGNFRLWDPILDWRATARLLSQAPTKTALCHILDGSGTIVRRHGKPVVVARDVEAGTEAHAAEILGHSSYAFVKWWPSNSPNWPGAGAGDNQRKTHNSAESKQGAPNDHRSRVIEAVRDFMDSRPPRTRQMSKERLF